MEKGISFPTSRFFQPEAVGNAVSDSDSVTRLQYPSSMSLAHAVEAPTEIAAPIKAPALAEALEQLAKTHGSNERELRIAIAQLLKKALADGRKAAEAQLLKDRRGRNCAERLCHLQDDIIGVLYTFAANKLYASDNPSEAERMAIIATGGYGRGLMAPGSDIDLLFLLPYKQTAWGEVGRRVHPLLSVGHGVESRSRDPFHR